MSDTGNQNKYEALKAKAFAIIKEEYTDGKGHALFFNVKKLKENFEYIGVWYACDKNEDTHISTEMYYASGETIKKPEQFSEEIKENSFKASPRFELPRTYDWVWVSPRNDGGNYCRMKIFTSQEEKIYIDYKVIKHRQTTYVTLASGIIKGGPARFFKLGIEDLAGKIDFNDTIMYVVLIEKMPPEDWLVSDSQIGIQRLPVRANEVKFSHLNSYSSWFGQNPMDDVN